MTELDIDGGKWCDGCYCYHIDVDKLISCLSRQGYDLHEIAQPKDREDD